MPRPWGDNAARCVTLLRRWGAPPSRGGMLRSAGESALCVQEPSAAAAIALLMSDSLTVERVEEIERLEALSPEWWALWERADSATPFQSPAWLLAWWRAFAPGRLLSFAFRRSGRLVGLAPFYLEERGEASRLLPVGIAASDYIDILAEPAARAELAAALPISAAAATGWEEWELPELGPGAFAARIACPEGCMVAEGTSSPCPVLPLPGCASDLPALLPARKRRKLRQAQHRADRAGGARFLSQEALGPQAWAGHLAEMHGERWRARGEPGLLADAAMAEFQAAALAGLLERGLARLYLLLIGGRRAAVYFGFLHRGRAYAYLSGFDPELAWQSPGVLLVAHAMEEAAREGARAFDFLRGAEPYKYEWGAADRWNRRRVFRRSRPRP